MDAYALSSWDNQVGFSCTPEVYRIMKNTKKSEGTLLDLLLSPVTRKVQGFKVVGLGLSV